MEKIKDFIYNTSDILIGLCIIVVVLWAVNSQLHPWFPYDENTAASLHPKDIFVSIFFGKSKQDDSSLSKYSETAAAITSADESLIKIDATTPNDTEDNKQTIQTMPDTSSANSSDFSSSNSSEHSETNKTQPNAPSVAPSSNKKSVSITISSGSNSTSVADTLYQNNLISDKAAFLKHIRLSGADTKIMAGTFQIPADSTPDEIIKLITLP